ncbi:copper resistance protein NlpE [Chitinophaga sp. sic0106]|uniref:copper resistance protein NlpE n=1 Tax=Chitinophaga sp. sic0106 TaxID=2854785 RepID=UPI001C47CA72|nr:copper resistance protein NlpE N-terminal domain-containing protein [Chitinophaga sp. sic0106]MBV7528587.1 copper resistance protein NlpE N-terminal domain-containing protein [Chitinophaga sp. sic0106]
MKYLTLVTALLFLLTTACNQANTQKSTADSTIIAGGTTEGQWVTYTGTLPCADCGGILTKLSINETETDGNRRFKLTETYQATKNGDQDFNSEGAYTVIKGSASDPNAEVIVLNPDKDKNLQRYFQKVSADELRMLDGEQKNIQSNLNYTLKKQ